MIAPYRNGEAEMQQPVVVSRIFSYFFLSLFFAFREIERSIHELEPKIDFLVSTHAFLYSECLIRRHSPLLLPRA